ncbi:MAG: hypothetical protein E7359_04205, partial [Clostridiales bacterium]|nr:hypothetical protein [Clostridiales bacterium]
MKINIFTKISKTFVLIISLLSVFLVGQFFINNKNNKPQEVEAASYTITTEAELRNMANDLSGTYTLANNITLTSSWTPIGSSSSPFKGTLNGAGFTVSNLNISATADYAGFFAYMNGGTVKNIKFTGVNIISTKSYVGVIAGCAKSGTSITDVEVNGYVKGANYVGGILGDAQKKNIINSTAPTLTRVTVKGTVYGANGVGGFMGGIAGGSSSTKINLNNSICYANVTGGVSTGGLVGAGSFSAKSGTFFAGSVAYNVTNSHTNNYPYMGAINGYGARNTSDMSDSGQRISGSVSSSQGITSVTLYNVSGNKGDNDSRNGVAVSVANNQFSVDAKIAQTTATNNGFSANESATEHYGILSNYSGLMLAFKMQDGTYKYYCTLNRENHTINSNLTINLDELPSYVDNFSNLSVTNNTVEIHNANDFEHLSYRINGAIPTTIGGTSYTSRSIATLNIKLMADIDLTKNADGTNRVSKFYGLANSEMNPYQGNFYGNNKSLTVNMNYPNAYMMGIVNVLSAESGTYYVRDLTVYGTISAASRAGIIATADGYKRSCVIELNNVKNYANITGVRQVGLVAYANSDNGGVLTDGVAYNVVNIVNCTNYGTIEGKGGSGIGAFFGEGSVNQGGIVTLNNCVNHGRVISTNKKRFGNLIGSARTATFNGTNKTYTYTSGALIHNIYVDTTDNSSNPDNVVPETVNCQVIYTLNIGAAVSGVSFYVNDTLMTTDSLGNVYFDVFVSNTEIDSTFTYRSTLENVNITVNTNTDLYSQINLVKEVSLDENNVYYSRNNLLSEFVINAKLTCYGLTSPQVVTMPTDLTQDKLNSTDELYLTVNSTNYIINSAFEVFKINSDINNYLTGYNEFLNYKSITSSNENSKYKDKIKSLKTSLETLTTKYTSLSEKTSNLFTSYIQNSTDKNPSTNIINTNAKLDNLLVYYNQIIDTVNLIVDDNNVTYGDTPTYKVEFITLNGSKQYEEVTYSYIVDGVNFNLEATPNTKTINRTLNNKVIYIYEVENVDINILQKDITITLKNTTKEYNAQNQEIDFEISGLINNDSISPMCFYNNDIKSKSVGDYTASVDSISGTNSIYYNYTAIETNNKLTITPKKLIITLKETSNEYTGVNHNIEFNIVGIIEPDTTKVNCDIKLNGNTVYNAKNVNTYNVVVTSVTNTNYYIEETILTYTITPKELIITANDCAVNYLKGYNTEEFSCSANGLANNESLSDIMSIDYKVLDGENEVTDLEVKDYTTKPEVTIVNEEMYNNYNIVLVDGTLTAEERTITFKTSSLTKTYDKQALAVTATVYENDILQNDGTVLVEYYKGSEKLEAAPIEAGNYTVKLSYIFNATNIASKEFDLKINQKSVTITIDSKTSVYGETLKELTSAHTEICTGDNLNITLTKESGMAAANYAITGTINNPNYNASFVNGTYTITKKEVIVTFTNNTLNYNGLNQIESLNKPSFVGIVSGEESLFTYSYYLGNNKIAEAKNVGTYVTKLDNVEFDNYTISGL